jgi:hypothetical protein
MKQRLLVLLLVLAVLGAGLAAGMWIERQRPVPPPPAKLMAELSMPATRLIPAAQMRLIKLQPAVNRAELSHAIAEIKPQIEAYRAKIEGIETTFETGLDAILTPAQSEAYAAAHRELAGRQVQTTKLDPAPPLSTETILALQNRPAYSVLNMVVIDLKLDWLTNKLSLAPAQTDQVRELLRQRRDSFIALVDATPPPSLMLSDLATVAQRLVTPAQAMTPAEKPGH